MGLSVNLESQKKGIETSVAYQNAMQKKNPNKSGNLDFAASSISIFSEQIRNEIRAKASKCNNASSQVVFNKSKNKSEVSKSVSNVNNSISELQNLISWANSATKDLSGIAGVSSDDLNTIKQNMTETMRFSSSIVSNSVSQANEALTKINASKNNSLGEVVENVQNKIEEVQQNTIQNTEQTEPVIIANNENTGTAATEAPKVTAAPAEAAKAPVAEAPKTDTVKTEPAKTEEKPVTATTQNTINNDTTKKTEPVKLDIKS